MLSEPRWLTTDQVEQLAFWAVEATGEPYSLLSPNLLESALASPRNHYHAGELSVPRLGARYLLSIARNHAFLQGNKRAGFYAASAFLDMNHYRLRAPDAGFADLFLATLDRRIPEDGFIRLFAESVAAPSAGLRRAIAATSGRITSPDPKG